MEMWIIFANGKAYCTGRTFTILKLKRNTIDAYTWPMSPQELNTVLLY